MGRLWDRLKDLAGLHPAPPRPVRRSPWVLEANLAPDPGLQCDFCGRAQADVSSAPSGRPEERFGLVHARYNEKLKKIVCHECQSLNRIGTS
ncbi:MAG: hypothetical protein ACE5JN_16985, partial [Candidatus Methylomirabilia bacterium]